MFWEEGDLSQNYVRSAAGGVPKQMKENQGRKGLRQKVMNEGGGPKILCHPRP